MYFAFCLLSVLTEDLEKMASVPPKEPPMHEQFEFRNMMLFGAGQKKKSQNKEINTMKLGEIEIEESSMFNIFKSFTKIYCVLTDDKMITYFRNKNDYYLNMRHGLNNNVKGFINLSQKFKIEKINDNIFAISIGNNKEDKIFKFKCGSKKVRDEWYDIINNIQ